MDAPHAVDLAAVLGTIDEPWSPRTVGTVNGYDVRVVRTQGEFTCDRPAVRAERDREHGDTPSELTAERRLL